MRRERYDYERLSDNAMLLSLWAQAQKYTGTETVGDRLKLMKLAFLAAYRLYLDRVKAFNLRFYRYTHGPYTGQVSDNWADLGAFGLLVEDELFNVTEEGMRLAEHFTQEVLGLEENKPIRHVLDSVIEEFAGLDTNHLLDKVYAMRCYTLDSPGRARSIKAIPQGRVFTNILEEEEAEEILVIPPGWQITLELTFHPDALRNLQRGIEDAHAGRLYGLEALGTDV
jgi:uncharacterized protein YwgA